MYQYLSNAMNNIDVEYLMQQHSAFQVHVSSRIIKNKASWLPGRKIRRSIGSFPRLYKCDVCEKIFSTKYVLERHTVRVHQGLYKLHCEHCGLGFMDGYALKVHTKEHHSESTERQKSVFHCSICQRSFTRKFDLQRHQTRVHQGSYKFQCETCGQGFMDTHALKVHGDNEHSGTGENSKYVFRCDTCKVSFTRKYDLQRHEIRIHQGAYKYHCELCGKGCMDSHGLKVHFEVNHLEEGAERTVKQPVICSVCQKEFSRKPELLRHMKSAHKGK